MAKAERQSNPFGWIIVGVLVGVIATMGVLLIASSLDFDGGYERGPTEIRAADNAATTVARPAPVAAAPKPQPAAPPVVAVPAPAAVEQPSVDAQMADDAAAAGMTSRAGSDSPTN